MGFDVEGARQAGYSDQEIADYLATQSRFDTAGARSAGYSDPEIISHLTSIAQPVSAASTPRVSAPRPDFGNIGPAPPTAAEVSGLQFDSGASPLSSAFDKLATAPEAHQVVPLGADDPRIAERAGLPEIEVSAAPMTLDQKVAYEEAHAPGTDGFSE